MDLFSGNRSRCKVMHVNLQQMAQIEAGMQYGESAVTYNLTDGLSEMKIPFSAIVFLQKKDIQNWGLQLTPFYKETIMKMILGVHWDP
jgi:hypothetical protein